MGRAFKSSILLLNSYFCKVWESMHDGVSGGAVGAMEGFMDNMRACRLAVAVEGGS